MEVYDFGLRLKELRESKGYSQAEVAKRLEISKNTISRYERNVKNPRIDILTKLVLLYNSSFDYILGLNERSNIFIDDMSEKDQYIITQTIEAMKDAMKLNPKK